MCTYAHAHTKCEYCIVATSVRSHYYLFHDKCSTLWDLLLGKHILDFKSLGQSL